MVERQGAVLALCARKITLTPQDQALRDRLEDTFRQAALCPPAVAELPVLLREPQNRLTNMLSLLLDAGVLLRVSPELLMHRDAVEQGRKVAIKLFIVQGRFTTMEFRDALGVSRKYAVPLLDYFDQQRLTVRNGNIRTPGAAVKKKL
jgi:selenocysteine-specific elongation factor